MGTELLRRGKNVDPPLWSAVSLLEDPNQVVRIHTEYLKAGADIITANTFRTNPRAFKAAGFSTQRARDATHQAVECARLAIEQTSGTKKIKIAGSVAPVEDCYRPDRVPSASELEAEHGVFSQWLSEVGVDVILVETMNTVKEARIAVEAAARTGTEVWASFVGTSNPCTVLSGENLERGLFALIEAGASMVGINCAMPETVAPTITQSMHRIDAPLIVYANGGKIRSSGDWDFDDCLSPERYAAHVASWLQMGVRVVGGCCGTTPAHIAGMRAVIDNRGVDTYHQVGDLRGIDGE